MKDARDVFAAAQAAHTAGDLEHAEGLYRETLALAPDAVGAWINLSGALLEQGRLRDADAAAQRAVMLAPGLLAARLNLVAVRHAGAGFATAADAAREALAAGHRDATLHYALGLGHDRAGRWREARAAYGDALALDPAHGAALSEALFLARCCGDFAAAARLGTQFRAALAAGALGLTPFAFLAERASAADQRRCAELWVAGFPAVAPRPVWQENADGRITLGYASADFHDHPTVHLLAAVLELHDRKRFKVIGYSWGPDDGSVARARVRAACDSFVELGGMSDSEAAQQVRANGVQILFDLKGHTADSRPGLFLARPAPVQVNWLGYPGALGGAAWDAILGDPIVTPPGCEAAYSERIVRLPECYQPNDPQRPLPIVTPPRKTLGLPEDAVVLCCMNAAWKVDAERFADWMAVLRAVPGTVLWLLDANPGQGLAANWRVAAGEAGVDSKRLVFASRAPQAEYLARYLCADLFLDSFPYTAHTTASDALWMGCPVLTETGTTFASRVATSLLHAVGLPQLAVSSRERYVERAIELARDPQALGALRAELERRRTSAVLFDAKRFTAALETACASLADVARRAAAR